MPRASTPFSPPHEARRRRISIACALGFRCRSRIPSGDLYGMPGLFKGVMNAAQQRASLPKVICVSSYISRRDLAPRSHQQLEVLKRRCFLSIVFELSVMMMLSISRHPCRHIGTSRLRSIQVLPTCALGREVTQCLLTCIPGAQYLIVQGASAVFTRQPTPRDARLASSKSTQMRPRAAGLPL